MNPLHHCLQGDLCSLEGHQGPQLCPWSCLLLDELLEMYYFSTPFSCHVILYALKLFAD